MTSVYLLGHIHEVAPGEGDELLIGVYSSLENAKKPLTRLRQQPGFRDFPDDFHVARHEVDEENRREGLVWALPSERLRRDPEGDNRVSPASDDARSARASGGAETTVYLVWHEYEIRHHEDETKLIGVYSSEGGAQEAIARLRGRPEFRDHPNDFQISDYTVDKDEEWKEGFISVSEALKDFL